MASGAKNVIVTGGTGALGQSVVAHLLEQGYQVHVTWLHEKELRYLEDFLGDRYAALTSHQADVADEAQVAALFATVAASGGLWGLVNVVGGFVWASLEGTDGATWQAMVQANATTSFLCSRAAAGPMRAAGGGRIVNVGSMPGLARGAANMSAYSASKAAVLNLTSSLAQELGADRITVNAIVPTTIDTPANRRSMPDADTSKWLPPEEIARVIGFLLSDDARIVTGAAVTLSLG